MADLDGVVRIGTEIDDSGFKKGMENLGKTAEKSSTKIKDFGTQADNASTKIKKTGNESDKADDKIKKTGDESDTAKTKVKKFGDQSDKAATDLKSLGNQAQKAGKDVSSFTDFLKADLLSTGITSIVSGFGSAIAESEEFTRTLSRLQTNAQSVGADFDDVQENFKDFVALTNQADSSAEALSNLLQTGFDNSQITQAVEALSGAVVKFPDTLNIESLADSLQETLATGASTGQFAELLDRLGIGAENFDTALAGATTQAEKQQLALETLANAGLNDIYNQYQNANAATLEFNKTQANLDIALSNFVQGTLPLFSSGFSDLSDIVLKLSESFKNGGIEGFADELKNVIIELAESVTQNAPQIIELGAEILNNLANGIISAYPTIIQQGSEILVNLINGILQKAPDLFSQASEIVKSFIANMQKNTPQILESGVNIINSLVTGILNAIPKLVAELPSVLLAITGFIKSALPQMAAAGVDILLNFAKGIRNNIPLLVEMLPEIISAIVSGLSDLKQGIIDAGKQIVAGIWEGINLSVDWLLSNIKNWCGSILDGIMAFFGIHSPSTVMRDKVGKMLSQGMILGIKSEAQKVISAIIQPIQTAQKQLKNTGLAKDFADMIKQAAETAKQEATSYTEISDIMISALQQGVDDNKENVINSIDELINNAIDVMQDEEQKEKIRSAGNEMMQTYKEALESGAEKAKNYISESISKITNEFQSQYDELVSKQQELENTLGGTYLFEVEDGEVFTEDVQKSIDVLNQYSEALDQLQERGISTAVLDEISRFSPEEGLSVIENLLSMTDEDFELLNEKWAEKGELAKEVAAQFYADQMEELQEGFIDEMMNTLEDVPDDVYDIGVDSVQGWIDGMNAMLPDLEAKARELARKAVSAMKSEMGIASPAKETQYIGEMTGEGFVVGLNGYADKIKQAINNLGFIDSIKSALPRLKSDVIMSLSNMSPMPAYATGGNVSNITTNEGAFVLNVGRIENTGSGSTEQFLQEAEYYRRRKASAKGAK